VRHSATDDNSDRTRRLNAVSTASLLTFLYSSCNISSHSISPYFSSFHSTPFYCLFSPLYLLLHSSSRLAFLLIFSFYSISSSFPYTCSFSVLVFAFFLFYHSSSISLILPFHFSYSSVCMILETEIMPLHYRTSRTFIIIPLPISSHLLLCFHFSLFIPSPIDPVTSLFPYLLILSCHVLFTHSISLPLVLASPCLPSCLFLPLSVPQHNPASARARVSSRSWSRHVLPERVASSR
jgi:hypothetical protein